MSSVQINYYSNSDVSIIDLMNTADASFIGRHQVSLTNYDNTSLPAIAAGSIVENNGGLFKFTTETAISGSPSDGTVYIYLVPSGDPALGTATVTPTFTNTAPTWSDSKQGWYGTSGSANYRYLEFKITKSTTYYVKSHFYDKTSINKSIVYAYSTSNQTINASTTTTIIYNTATIDSKSEYNVSNGNFTPQQSGNYRIVSYLYFSASSTGQNGIKIIKNSSPLTYPYDIYPTYYSGEPSVSINFIIQLNVGDIISVAASQSSAANLTLYPYCTLSIERVD